MNPRFLFVKESSKEWVILDKTPYKTDSYFDLQYNKQNDETTTNR